MGGLSADAAHHAVEEAQAIWGRAGVEVRTVERADTPDRRPDIFVYFTGVVRPSDDGAPHRTPIAWITFAGGHPTNRIFVSTTAARQLLQRDNRLGVMFSALPTAGQERMLARVLGRALAHEVGHYLFASTEHTRTGLMRATQSIWALAIDDVSLFRVDTASKH